MTMFFNEEKEMKTSELTGAALDWAVAKCEQQLDEDSMLLPVEWHLASFSTDWAYGGEIIEREGIQIQRHASVWIALPPDTEFSEEAYQEGDTPLVAAMRCYVASKFGDEIDVPEELL
jgi:hypothetical protein